MRRLLTLFVGGVAAAVTGACASTGAVPRPFPGPGGAPSTAAAARRRRGGSRRRRASGSSRNEPSVDTYALTGTALSLRGTPYRNGGADPNGFDCSGFTQYVFGHYGIPLPRERQGAVRDGSGREGGRDRPRRSDLLHDRRAGSLARGDLARRRRVRSRAELDRGRPRRASQRAVLVAALRRRPADRLVASAPITSNRRAHRTRRRTRLSIRAMCSARWLNAAVIDGLGSRWFTIGDRAYAARNSALRATLRDVFFRN